MSWMMEEIKCSQLLRITHISECTVGCKEFFVQVLSGFEFAVSRMYFGCSIVSFSKWCCCEVKLEKNQQHFFNFLACFEERKLSEITNWRVLMLYETKCRLLFKWICVDIIDEHLQQVCTIWKHRNNIIQIYRFCFHRLI